MSATDPELLKAWLAYWNVVGGSSQYASLFGASSDVWDLCHDEPDKAWEFILSAWAADQSTPVAERLSAGPLEDLLAYHGAYVIESIEAEARANPSFAHLLGGVWQNAISDEIWSRVQAVWDRRGWDGIPFAKP